MSGTYYHYCSVCGTRLGSSDFVSGRAVRIGHEIRCKECVTRPSAKRRSTNTTRRTVVSS
jgi:hypothetical protein